jgi:transposase
LDREEPNMQDYIRDSVIVSNVGPSLFVGLDVDKASISASIHNGERIIKSLKMPYDSKNLLSFIDRQYPNERVMFAYEAGPTGFGLYDAITAANHGCLVVSPSNIPCAPNNRVKTNRLDSVKLAELLNGNQLKGIRVPRQAVRELRSLVHLRYTYMRESCGYKCRIKGELLKEGIPFPEAPKGSQWGQKVFQELREYDFSPIIGFEISNMLDHIEHLAAQIKLTEVAIRSHVNGDEDLRKCVEYLMSCPGIGWRIACYAIARIGDWRLLGPSKESGAFFGLVPSERSTGDKTDRGAITKCGDPRLRSMLIQGAWAAIRKDKELKAFYDRIRASHSSKVASRVAIVAVARKLAERMHSVLKEQRRYEVHEAA